MLLPTLYVLATWPAKAPDFYVAAVDIDGTLLNSDSLHFQA